MNHENPIFKLNKLKFKVNSPIGVAGITQSLAHPACVWFYKINIIMWLSMKLNQAHGHK